MPKVHDFICNLAKAGMVYEEIRMTVETAYPGQCLSRSQIYKLIKDVKNGEDVTDKRGRQVGLRPVRDADFVKAVRADIEEDRRLTVAELAERHRAAKDTIHKVLTVDLGLAKKGDKWVAATKEVVSATVSDNVSVSANKGGTENNSSVSNAEPVLDNVIADGLEDAVEAKSDGAWVDEMESIKAECFETDESEIPDNSGTYIKTEVSEEGQAVFIKCENEEDDLIDIKDDIWLNEDDNREIVKALDEDRDRSTSSPHSVLRLKMRKRQKLTNGGHSPCQSESSGGEKEIDPIDVQDPKQQCDSNEATINVDPLKDEKVDLQTELRDSQTTTDEPRSYSTSSVEVDVFDKHNAGGRPSRKRKTTSQSVTKKRLLSYLNELHPIVCCLKCNVGFPSKTALKKHMETHQAKTDSRFTCDICQASFSSASNLLMHQIIHQGLGSGKPLKKATDSQELSIDTLGDMAKQRKTDQTTPSASHQVECDQCLRQFDTISGYNLHLNACKPLPKCHCCNTLVKDASLADHLKLCPSAPSSSIPGTSSESRPRNFTINLAKAGLPYNEIVTIVEAAYPGECLSESQVYKIIKDVKAGKDCVDRRGRHSTRRQRSTDLIAAVKLDVEADSCITVSRLAKKHNVSRRTIHRVLIEDLGLTRKSTGWVP